MIKNAVLVCHRCHAEFSMDDEQIEQQKAALEETDHSLPLFDLIKSDLIKSDHIKPEHEASQDEQEQEEDVEEADLTPEQSLEEVDESPVPAFLDGDHEYAEKIKREETSAKSNVTDAIEEKPRPEKIDQGDDSDIEEIQTPLDEVIESSENEVFEATSHDEVKEPDHEEPLPPARKSVVIWPWLITMLLIISGTGFWFKQDVWLDHPWVRSLLINMHLPVEVRNKDWFIIPGSVQGNWLKRDDGSQVLTVQGRIENRLYCELPPPRILVRFFDDTGITESLGEKLLSITEPPSMEQIKHAPLVMPDIDRVPVEAQGERGFFLVLDSLPEHTADFTLSPVVNREQ